MSGPFGHLLVLVSTVWGRPCHGRRRVGSRWSPSHTGSAAARYHQYSPDLIGARHRQNSPWVRCDRAWRDLRDSSLVVPRGYLWEACVSSLGSRGRLALCRYTWWVEPRRVFTLDAHTSSSIFATSAKRKGISLKLGSVVSWVSLSWRKSETSGWFRLVLVCETCGVTCRHWATTAPRSDTSSWASGWTPSRAGLYISLAVAAGRMHPVISRRQSI